MKVDNASIELSEKQLKKFNSWIKSFKKLPDIGATGGHFGLEITFTSLGSVIIGKSWDGKQIDLTETDDFI